MISKKSQKIKPSPTLALTALAKEMAAQGHDVISLSVGEPDWNTFSVIAQSGIEAIKKGQTKYSAANGIPELRGVISERTNQELGTKFNPQQVTVTAGGKFSIFAAFHSILDPLDEVLIPAPYWVSYPTMVEMNEGTPVIVPTKFENNFKMTEVDLKKFINSKTKLLILNSPSNPTGEIYSKAELEKLAKVLRDFPNCFILCDDIYNRLTFDGSIVAPHILHVAPDLAYRVIIVNGASKAFSMTGWRVGWALARNEIIQAMTNYQSQTVSCAATFSQIAAVAGFRDGESELKKALVDLKARRDFAYEKFSQLPQIKLSCPGGAFYLWPNISSYLGKSYLGTPVKNSSDFSKLLLEHEKVAVVPGIEFGTEGFIRLCYTINNDRMKEAVTRFARFLSQLK